MEGVVLHGEGEIDAGTAAAGFVGGEDYFGGAERLAGGQLRLDALLQ